VAEMKPIPGRAWPPEMLEALAAMTPPNPRYDVHPGEEGPPKPINMLGIFAHHPALARAFFTFNGHILMGTTLSERQRELLTLRTAALRNCGYAWVQHLFIGHDAGLDDEEIARVAFGPDAPFWSDLEAALLRAADELVHDGEITDATWEVLSGQLDYQQLLDVIFTVGAYDTLTMMMRSVRLQLDDEFYSLWERR